MASIRKVTHKNGRVVYRIAISLGRDSNGKKIVKNLTYVADQSASPRQQEKEALKYAMSMEDKVKYGYDIKGEKEMFDDFARQWLASVRDGIACGTYVGYEHLLECRILPYFKGRRITQVRTADIEAFYKTLTGSYSSGTINRYANVLSCIFKTAKRWNIIEDNPCRDAKKPGRRKDIRELRYFTPQQSLMFLRSLDLSYDSEEKGDKPYVVSMQYKVFYTLSLFCGFRKGETLALHWSDIDFDIQEISITKAIGRTEEGFDYKEPKNAASVRRVPFPDHALLLLKDYQAEYETLKRSKGSRWAGEDNLFVRSDGSLMGHTTTYQHFMRHLKRYNQWVTDHPNEARESGMERLPLIPLHGLRHSCATLLNYLEVNIVDIAKYMGHANCSTTMNIYAHSFEARKYAAQKKLNEFMQENACAEG